MKIERDFKESSVLENNDLDRSFAVIGAGASGLCMAKYLLQAGYKNVTIFEIGSQIGGLWCYENDNGRSSCYKTLHINTARDLTQFSDFPFSSEIQLFPSHWDMHEYLKAYAKKFDLERLIRFRSRIIDVRPNVSYAPSSPKWDVTLEGGAKETFDRIVVASGHLSVPLHFTEAREKFEGEYVHAHYYREPEPYVGKRVCIIGVGNSACDIASDICATAARTVMVARSGVMIGPKLMFGIPFTDISMRIHNKWFPDWLRRKVMSLLIYVAHGRMENLGFKPLTSRAHPTTNAVIVQHIAYRRVCVKQGIDKFDGKTIHFSDGTSEDFDVLISATGYEVDLPFIPSEIVPVEDNSVDLYRRIVPPAWSGIYFLGFFNTTTALNYIFEFQSKWVVALETGLARLPSAAEMKQRIAEKREWIARFYKKSQRHTIEEEHVFYVEELRKNLKQRKSKRVPVI